MSRPSAALSAQATFAHDTVNVAARERLAVALDFPTAKLALDCVDRLDSTCRWMKVGLELYCAAGNGLIETLRARGLEVFLDLKLHDIPNTVAGAIRTIANTGASLLTLHAAGGEAMLHAAARASAETAGCPKLLAVTVLTSVDAAQLEGVGVVDTPGAQVLRLATLARTCGIHDLVCSSEETAMLRASFGSSPFLLVPGIRPAGTASADQKRTATPREAIRRGASMLVVGRPITHAAEPAEAARQILAEMTMAV